MNLSARHECSEPQSHRDGGTWTDSCGYRRAGAHQSGVATAVVPTMWSAARTSPRSVPGEEDNAPVAKLDWDKAKRVSPDVEPNPIRPPSDRELGFLETQQARLRRKAAVRRERDWLLLDADRRPVASARAESAERAREQFKARGLAGAWLRQVGERR